MDSTAMDPIGNKYWGLWAAAKRSSSTTTSPIPAWAAYGSGGEPTSWEEQAFARDAAAHLGGCVWPPRSYSCSFCQREFRSAQALGGHMNVHRRDRALLRQRSSPNDDEAPGRDKQPHQQGGPLLLQYRSAAISNPSTTIPTTTTTTVVPPSSSYLATITKESKNKLSSMAMRVEATDRWCDHDDDNMDYSGRIKRRRLMLDHPLQIFVQQAAPARESQLGGVDHHDAKVLNTIIATGPNSSSSPLVDEQEVLDLELRLGTCPQIT